MAIKVDYFCRKMFGRIFVASGLSGIALAIANVIDAICVGSAVGETGLAAIGIVSPLYMMYNVIGYGFSVGGSVTFAKLMGEGKKKEATDHFNEMVILLMIISVFLTILGNVFIIPLLSLLGVKSTSGILFELCKDYLGILLNAMPVFMLNFIFNDFARSDDDQYLATIAFVTGCSLDFALNLLFVTVLNFGIKGAAYATVIAQLVSVLILSIHFFRKDKLLKIKIVKPDLSRCFKSLKTGISTSIESLFVLSFLLVANWLLISSTTVNGELYVAVFDVVMNISYITNSIFLASSETLRPLASTFYAEHNKNSMFYSLKLSVKWGYILGSVLIAFIALFADEFAMLFGLKSAESLSIAIYAIRIFCIGVLFSGFSIILSAFYQSVDEEKKAASITIMRSFIVLIPVTLLIGIFKTELFWYAMPLSEIISFLIVMISFLKIKNGQDNNDNYFSYTIYSIDKMGELLQKTEEFCEKQEANIKQTNMVVMFIEETCEAIIHNAFKGNDDEYIQITLVSQNDGIFVLHVRDSAVLFNPFDMKTQKLAGESDDDSFMNSIGILMMKNKAKTFCYRRYQGFNMLTITF